MRSQITAIEIGSNPAKGSSYIIISGSNAMALARATRLAMPPESSVDMSL